MAMCASLASAFTTVPMLPRRRASLISQSRPAVALRSGSGGNAGGDQAFAAGLLSRIEELKKKEQQEISRSSQTPVYLAMFNANTSEEGVHTLESPPGSGINTVMAFHGKEDCLRFCLLLSAQGFFDPEPRKIPLNQVYMFADATTLGKTMTMEVLEVEEGERIVPPELNVEVLKDYSPDEGRLNQEKASGGGNDFSDIKSKLDRLMGDDSEQRGA